MNYEMIHTTISVDYINKLLSEFITIIIINSQSTFDCAGNLNLKFGNKKFMKEFLHFLL